MNLPPIEPALIAAEPIPNLYQYNHERIYVQQLVV